MKYKIIETSCYPYSFKVVSDEFKQPEKNDLFFPTRKQAELKVKRLERMTKLSGMLCPGQHLITNH